jgi:hypothetical protein
VTPSTCTLRIACSTTAKQYNRVHEYAQVA